MGIYIYSNIVYLKNSHCVHDCMFFLSLRVQVDEKTGRVTGTHKTYAICGFIRGMVSYMLMLMWGDPLHVHVYMQV